MQPRTSAKALAGANATGKVAFGTEAGLFHDSGIPAVICGHMAYSRIGRSAGELSGQGLALGGIITGYCCIGISLVVLPIMFAIAIPNFVKARQTAQQNACINNLRMIEAAKDQWALDSKATNTQSVLPQDIDPYFSGGFISLQCPAGGTYTINVIGEEPTCSIPNHKLSSFRR